MPKVAPDLSFERAAAKTGARFIVGLDEVGRGPWAGPVVACAARLIGPAPAGLNDSKKLTAKRREAMVPLLLACCEVGFGEASAEEIDALNIRQATHLAMRRAVADLPQLPDYLLIDGNDCPAWVDCPRDVIVKGDSRSLSIAAASVLAKTRRDKGMVALAQQFPGYGWDRNAGYGTKAHQEGLKNHGVTPYHRRSFAPIHKILCQTG
ncbi:ribonuclease HII [Jannaschia pohangensis]|uniref:Ribonuclease HII n=1 Tax=Jannaschia pohangensis TaxID=390807 RepID=A0A1I3TAI2_9RHOB|nr:ribonuclease HII [Jannaschia pohangensis]SFJ67945.1 RNase HII [Jannaschia pohangensis]